MAVDAMIKYEEKFAQPIWKHVSKRCKNLISRMLDENVAKRLTIEQVLDHPWMKDEEESSDDDDDYKQ